MNMAGIILRERAFVKPLAQTDIRFALYAYRIGAKFSLRTKTSGQGRAPDALQGGYRTLDLSFSERRIRNCNVIAMSKLQFL